MKIVAISDTHNMGKEISVPHGDVLIHAGDHTMRGTEKETKQALDWLSSLPHRHKIFIAGNHDWFFYDNAPRRFRNWSLYKHYTKTEMLKKYPNLIYLEDSSVIIEGRKFYGSPWQPWYYDWAFNFPLMDGASKLFPEMFRDQKAAIKKWSQIPKDTNVLITHCPPTGIGDKVIGGDDHVADTQLRERLFDLPMLSAHVFGHIHTGHGLYLKGKEDGFDNLITFVNAAICDADYEPIQPPIVFEN